MKAKLFSMVLMLAVSAAVPAVAGKVYIPVVQRTGGSHATEVWLSNAGAQERRYEASFLAADTDGTLPRTPAVRTAVVGGRTVRLVNPGPAGMVGLLEIDAAQQIQIDARLANNPSGGTTAYTRVPVISSDNALPAAATISLLGLARTNSGGFSDLGLVNLGSQTAQCAVTFTRADGTGIGQTVNVAVQPLSLRYFNDALGILGESQASDARAQVTCDKTFFAYAAVFSASQFTFATPAATGASTLGGGTTPPPPPPPGEAIVFTSPGIVHAPTTGNAVRAFVVPVTQALSLRRFTVEFDVIPGPWTATKPDGSHNLIWIYRGKYRSNTIANLNAFGPARNGVKNTQNVDMAAGRITTDEKPLVLTQGVTYHVKSLYDAENQQVTTTISSGGQTLLTLQHAATARDRILKIPASGFNVQFGHTAAQAAGGAEFPSYGWTYRDLRIEMLPY
jgi:hypothetical protein